MQFIKIGEDRFISSMTKEEWQPLLDFPYKDRYGMYLEHAAMRNECFLSGKIGQHLYAYFNGVRTKRGFLFRLCSDNLWWNNPEKKLRLQTLEDWRETEARRKRKPPP